MAIPSLVVHRTAPHRPEPRKFLDRLDRQNSYISYHCSGHTSHLGHGIIQLHILFRDFSAILDRLCPLLHTVALDFAYTSAIYKRRAHTIIDGCLADPDHRIPSCGRRVIAPHRTTNYWLYSWD